MARYVMDLESDGLLYEASKIHCMVLCDYDTDEVLRFTPTEIARGLEVLMQADQVIGHNLISFDLALASRLYPWFHIDRERVVDTLVLSRLLYTNLSDLDQKPSSKVDRRLTGSHSLKAWGQRLGFHKLDYDGGWETFSNEMLEYNEVDAAVTKRLFKLLIETPGYSQKAADLEHQVAHIIAQQERAGVSFDDQGARSLTAQLLARRAELESELQDAFPPWTIEEVFIPKVNNKARGYVKGEPFTKKHTTVFNPSSRFHIADRLKALYGWKPQKYTEAGTAIVDEDVLSALPYPEAKLLNEYLLLQKRLGMLAEGKNAWLKLSRNGEIHGEVITNGAVTGRATHRNPNLAQVPAVGAPYGHECRSLFTASPGRTLVGIDVSGLELRMLGHFMARYDDGKYAREVVEGDVHTANQLAAGLPTRNNAKTFIYAFLYGAGPDKIGSIVGGGRDAGVQLRKKFLAATPALAKLIDAVKKAAGRGYLVGLDGRRLHIRSDHAALNTLLQSAGALICKQWMAEVDREIIRRGWRHKVQQVLFVHDELQFDCDKDIAEEFGKMAVECISKAGEFFEIRCPLTGEYKIGANWAETH